MSDGTRIEWSDATWNVTTGCTKVSPGCDHCYIERTPPLRMAGRRFDSAGAGGTTGVLVHPERLTLPLRWRKPRRVFVNSLSDLFHDDVPNELIAEVFAVMALAPRHTFQLLTKRHGRMRSLLSDDGFQSEVAHEVLSRTVADGQPLPDHLANPKDFTPWWPLANVWLGVSAEDQHWADIRIPALLATPAAVRWISAEPLLGPVSLDPWRNPGDAPNPRTPADTRLDWVVVGGESGPGARPMHPGWARDLRDQCAAAGVPYLFKQWGSHDEHGRRVSKKAAGRELDGRLHDGYPVPA